ncbi:hypothetical protein [Rhodovulum steppense]|uniref:Uncharacterized protein n=1 Tax=Rhodovulum steppense TaxID=540251 RepID=A0A4R1YLU9_9RHOB|nr:hypothetical protein [Rhodovulum steppense]TCM78328.1 hypothetical protein EV216_1263 [Rhodovulum steppense]
MTAAFTERSREARQSDSILDWLQKSEWTPRQAACLLVGVLPPEPSFGIDDRPFGAWLPGQEPWEHDREIWENLVAAEVDQMERKLATIPNIGIMSPAELLAYLSRRNGKLLPPWAAALLDSKSHAEALPAMVRSLLRDALGKSREANPSANASYAAKLKKDPDWDLQVAEAERRWRDGQTNKQIADALADRFPAKTEGGIAVWTRKFSKNISAEAQTAGFRAYKDRMNR